MKSGILYDDRDSRLGDAPEPRLGPDEVLVAPSYTGIFGTDLYIYRGEISGTRGGIQIEGESVRRWTGVDGAGKATDGSGGTSAADHAALVRDSVLALREDRPPAADGV
jgi:threonine dehydrogenase-like Zn-dependent dehydrogenase